MNDEIGHEQAHSAADDADGEAVAEKDAGDAGAGCADAFDDADVAGFFHDDHEEDAEDQENGDDADDGEEDDQQGFFVLDGVEEIGLFFVPGFDSDRAGSG